MRASVAVSSGAMCTNCDDVQHAVQPSHGTFAARSPRMAATMSVAHAANEPASRSVSSMGSFTRASWRSDAYGIGNYARSLLALAFGFELEFEAFAWWQCEALPLEPLLPLPGVVGVVVDVVAAPPDVGMKIHAPTAPAAIDASAVATTNPLRTCIMSRSLSSMTDTPPGLEPTAPTSEPADDNVRAEEEASALRSPPVV